MDYYDFEDKLDTRSFTVEAVPDLWHSFDFQKYPYVANEKSWIEFKFLKDDNSLNEQVNSLDNTRGGIYIFYINPNIVPGIHKYIVYIGRVQKTNRQNMRKRMQEYFREFVINASNQRYDRKVHKVFRFWKSHIYVKCLFLGDSEGSHNSEIKELEKDFIRIIRPYYNDEIPKVRNLPVKTSFEEVF